MTWLTKLGGLLFKSDEGIIGQLADVADKFIETKDEKRVFIEKGIERVFQDRKDARENSKNHKPLIFIYAIVFLVGYLGLTFFFLRMLFRGIELNDYAQTIIATLWGGFTAKINTIVDFLFGASEKDGK